MQIFENELPCNDCRHKAGRQNGVIICDFYKLYGMQVDREFGVVEDGQEIIPVKTLLGTHCAAQETIKPKNYDKTWIE